MNLFIDGMKENYIDDLEYQIILRKFMALAFVEINDIRHVFEDLALELLDYDHNERYEKFIEYFKNTRVGRPLHRPLHRPLVLQCGTRVKQQKLIYQEQQTTWKVGIYKFKQPFHATIQPSSK